MTESPEECKACGAASKYLTKVPSIISDVKESTRDEKVGSVVNSHIEETKEELRKEKEELKRGIDI